MSHVNGIDNWLTVHLDDQQYIGASMVVVNIMLVWAALRPVENFIMCISSLMIMSAIGENAVSPEMATCVKSTDLLVSFLTLFVVTLIIIVIYAIMRYIITNYVTKRHNDKTPNGPALL